MYSCFLLQYEKSSFNVYFLSGQKISCHRNTPQISKQDQSLGFKTRHFLLFISKCANQQKPKLVESRNLANFRMAINHAIWMGSLSDLLLTTFQTYAFIVILIFSRTLFQQTSNHSAYSNVLHNLISGPKSVFNCNHAVER